MYVLNSEKKKKKWRGAVSLHQSQRSATQRASAFGFKPECFFVLNP